MFHGFGNRDVGYASESGDQFILHTNVALGPYPFSGGNAYVFSRDPARGEWAFNSLASPSLGVQSIGSFVFDPFDFSRVAFDDLVGSNPSPAGVSDTTLLGPPAGPYAVLHADPGAHIFEGEAKQQPTHVLGASRDLGYLVLESVNQSLLPPSTHPSLDQGAHALYESTGDGECAAEAENCPLIDVNNNGELLSRCGAVLGQGGQHDEPGTAHNAVSADGSRIFFTAPDPQMTSSFGPVAPGCWNGSTLNAPQLFLRSGGATVEVSKPEAGAEATRHPAVYVGASEDGSRVFFVSEGELATSDTGVHDPELYSYDTETEDLTRVSAGEPTSPAATAGAGIWTVPAVSADGSTVYFTATGQLTSTAPATTGNEVNLYRYDTTAPPATATTYVATVGKGDYKANTTPLSWWGGHIRFDFALTPMRTGTRLPTAATFSSPAPAISPATTPPRPPPKIAQTSMAMSQKDAATRSTATIPPPTVAPEGSPAFPVTLPERPPPPTPSSPPTPALTPWPPGPSALSPTMAPTPSSTAPIPSSPRTTTPPSTSTSGTKAASL